MAAREPAAGTQAVAPLSMADGSAESGDGALWLLRQLRPVSYSFRKGTESKYMRFGFIADELENVVPNVVRTTSGKAFTNQQAVMYQDLIALLTSAAQSQQQTIDDQQAKLEQQDETLDLIETRMEMLRAFLEQELEAEQAELDGRELPEGDLPLYDFDALSKPQRSAQSQDTNTLGLPRTARAKESTWGSWW